MLKLKTNGTWTEPQVKLIDRGLAGVSNPGECTPLGLNPGPFLRSQGPRMGYTSEPSPLGLKTSKLTS